MGKKQINESMSSFLVQPYMIAALFVLAFLTSYFGMRGPSLFLFVFGLITLVSNRWASVILRDLEADSQGQVRTCYPGDQVTVDYSVENHKWIPLLWLQFIQDKPDKDCLEFDIDMEGGVKKLSRLMWYGRVDFTCTYRAARRGLYAIKDVLIRSGDGFGLTQTEQRYGMAHPSAILIYPELRPVKTDLFHRNLWSGASGRKGYVEDVTVLKSVRDYQETDSWKRIDWRSAAMGQDLQTKLFETVRPQGILFIIDGASFRYQEEETVIHTVENTDIKNMQEGELLYQEQTIIHERVHEEIEEAISTVASLILELEDQKISSGLALPQTDRAAALSLLPGENVSSGDLIAALASYDETTATSIYHREGLAGLSERNMQVFLLAYSEETMKISDLSGLIPEGKINLTECGKGGLEVFYDHSNLH